MVSIFSYLDYREALLALISKKKEQRKGFTLRSLAEKCRIQSTYLSNVLHGRADLSSDQIYALAQELGLSETENDYLNLLLSWDRSGVALRKKRLKQKIDDLRAREFNTKKALSKVRLLSEEECIREYYLDPFHMLVHVFLTIERYNRRTSHIADALGVDSDRIKHSIDTLVRLGYIEKSESGYDLLKQRIHLPESSPVCRPHQELMRIRSLSRLQSVQESARYGVSVTFSSDAQVLTRLKEVFLEFLAKAEKIVDEGPAERAYQMNFDLFPWH